MARKLRDYGLGWVLLVLFLVSWAVQTWTGWREFMATEASHGQAAHVFGSNGYVWDWAQATFENWQSEFLQLLTMVTLTSFLIFRGSAESRDSDDELKAAIERLELRMSQMAGQSPTTIMPDRSRDEQDNTRLSRVS